MIKKGLLLFCLAIVSFRFDSLPFTRHLHHYSSATHTHTFGTFSAHSHFHNCANICRFTTLPITLLFWNLSICQVLDATDVRCQLKLHLLRLYLIMVIWLLLVSFYSIRKHKKKGKFIQPNKQSQGNIPNETSSQFDYTTFGISDVCPIHTIQIQILIHWVCVIYIPVLPQQGPKISGGRPRYQIGDEVNVNCTSGRSKPATHLTWFINGEPASADLLKYYNLLITGREGLETTTLGLNFKVK